MSQRTRIVELSIKLVDVNIHMVFKYPSEPTQKDQLELDILTRSEMMFMKIFHLRLIHNLAQILTMK